MTDGSQRATCPILRPCRSAHRSTTGDQSSWKLSGDTEMAAQDLITAARDDTYASRVAMIQLKVGQNVASEDPGTANHAERIAYAYYVIRGAENPKMVAAHVNSQPGISVQIEADPGAR